MCPLAGSDDRPDVVLVHGVGVGPESFAATRAALSAAGRRVHGVVRPGYGLGEHAMDLNDQVDPVLDGLDRLTHAVDLRPSSWPSSIGTAPAAAWVGVSGGATLGVIAATRRPAAISVAVLHEPLIGSAAPELHAMIRHGADRLAAGSHDGREDADRSRARAVEYMTGLVGAEIWEMLGPEGRAAVEARAALIACEVPRFARFEPSPIPADGEVRVVITVGERSPAVRHDAARRAADLLYGSVHVIPAVGHLPQVEASTEFAELIEALT
jgi:pimeloyl-ACP methyl ester carboxylesterase